MTGGKEADGLVIQVKDLSKRFGDTVALSKMTFSVETGEVLGFLGPNAAGKTTTMRIITGFLPPDGGSVTVGGHGIPGRSMAVRRQIGYLPENVALYTTMTVGSYLVFMASIRDVPARHRRRAVETAMERCGVSSVADRRIGNLSRGFRQRVGLAQAIVHEPPVLILDEPTIGLDPKQIHEVRNLIRELGGNHTVILSSHILPEVHAVCDRVVIVHRGSVVAEDSPRGLMATVDGSLPLTVSVRGPSRAIAAFFGDREGIDLSSLSVSEDGITTAELRVPADAEFRERLAAEIVGKGWGLLHLSSGGVTLEDVFLELTREDTA